ncbi:MAG: hypothetical protein KAS99_01210 [Candidatus Omnitrophica bacterium]|nr:hypothetical protein [Candidatus Omnitrophota bacterium]
MRKAILKLICTGILCLWFTGCGFPLRQVVSHNDIASMTPKEITTRAVEAVGGRERWDWNNIPGYTIIYYQCDHETGVHRRVSAWVVSYNKCRIEIETYRGTEKVTNLLLIADSGKTITYENGKMVNEVKDETERNFLINSRLQAYLHEIPGPFVNLDKKADKAELLGEEKVLGRPCYLLAWKQPEKEVRISFDKETFYLLKVEVIRKDRHMVKYATRYRKFGDVFFPSIKEMYVNGELKVRLLIAHFSLGLPDESLFRME